LKIGIKQTNAAVDMSATTTAFTAYRDAAMFLVEC
jgi:hypothetical protein